MTLAVVAGSIRKAPWTQILLFALLVTNCMNWVALRRVRLQVEAEGWSQHYDYSSFASTLGAMNDRLGEISDATQILASCSKEIRPIWCRH